MKRTSVSHSHGEELGNSVADHASQVGARESILLLVDENLAAGLGSTQPHLPVLMLEERNDTLRTELGERETLHVESAERV